MPQWHGIRYKVKKKDRKTVSKKKQDVYIINKCPECDSVKKPRMSADGYKVVHTNNICGFCKNGMSKKSSYADTFIENPKARIKESDKTAGCGDKHLPDIDTLIKRMRKRRGPKDSYMKKISNIDLDIDIGDVVLGGRYKNKRQVVERLKTDKLGQPTYNRGKKLLAVRIEKKLPHEYKSQQTRLNESKGLDKKAFMVHFASKKGSFIKNKYQPVTHDGPSCLLNPKITKGIKMEKKAFLQETYDSAFEDELRKLAGQGLPGKEIKGKPAKPRPAPGVEVVGKPTVDDPDFLPGEEIKERK